MITVIRIAEHQQVKIHRGLLGLGLGSIWNWKLLLAQRS